MIYVITHKEFDIRYLDRDLYQVIQVGKEKKDVCGYLRDDIGDNIADKNDNYCELTGLYWAWKNCQETEEEITGIVHYRRYFTTNKEYCAYKKCGVIPSVLKDKEIIDRCNKYTIILPKAYYTINNLYASYQRCHNVKI